MDRAQRKLTPRRKGEQNSSSGDSRRRAPICAVVGIGASAGGLEAFKKFFQSMPPDCGMAFVLIPHLDPRHESMLAELLSKQTRMSVEQVCKRSPVRPNHVYVMPPDHPLRIAKGVLLLDAQTEDIPRTPIDRFLRSLAEDQGENAIGIVLSGTGSDGTLGLMAVKEHGGFTMAQAADSARYDSMPRSAIATGLVDQVLPVEEMPGRLLEYVRHVDRLAKRKRPDGLLEDAESNLTRILQLLRQKTGHDFTHYKKSTLIRRIQRRMQFVQDGTTAQYVERLRKDAKEIELLFKDLLIGVTLFFRDPEAFGALAREAIPKILAKKGPDANVRIWVSACATGEEAYSVAILVSEQVAKLKHPPRVQIFATDIDDQALEVARQAKFPEGIADQVSPARLERFFTKEVHQYRVKKPIRDMVIFSRHNVTKDPPFSRIDLICCRNLLIYLEGDLQKRLISLFHYALRPGGYLFLGSSENVVGPPGLFRTIDKRHSIFLRKAAVLGSSAAFPLTDLARREGAAERHATMSKGEQLGATLEHLLVEQFGPAGVVVDEHGDVVYFCGDTGNYLEPSRGTPSSNVLSMARKGLRLDLRSAIAQSVKTKKAVDIEGLGVQTNGGIHRVNLIVRPLRELGEDAGLFLVVFQDADPRKPRPVKSPDTGKGSSLADRLEGELRSTKEHLQSTIEELETSNEELKSSNEELMSMNEELQSTNEELQTSKEELQSVNEELETVNAELGAKVEELDSVNSDLQNLLQSTQIATIFLDNDLNISKFTAAATDVFRVIESDVGRPIRDITARFLDGELEGEIRQVLRTLITRERQVRLAEREGSYIMRIAPYRTLDHVIQGVVVTFFDVTELEHSRAQAALLGAIVKHSTDAIFTKTLEGMITSWNRGAERVYGWSAEEVIGRSVTFLAPPELQGQAGEIIARVRRGETVENLETTRLRKDGTRIDVSLTCSPVTDHRGDLTLVSVIARDVTERKKAERDLQIVNDVLRQANEDLQHLTYAASHDLQEPLRMVSNYASLLSKSTAGSLDEKSRMFLGHVESGARRMDSLLTAMKEYWTFERLAQEPAYVDAGKVLDGALRNLEHAIEESKAEIVRDPLPRVLVQETPFMEVFQNLIGNALKYRRDGVAPRVHVSARNAGTEWEFSISDNGIGIPPKHRESIFLPFKRLHGESVAGAGMGLAICSRIIKQFGGRIWVESGEAGSTFRFTLPSDGAS